MMLKLSGALHTDTCPRHWCSAQEQQVQTSQQGGGGGEGLPNSHPDNLARTHLELSSHACKRAGDFAPRFKQLKTGLAKANTPVCTTEL